MLADTLEKIKKSVAEIDYGKGPEMKAEKKLVIRDAEAGVPVCKPQDKEFPVRAKLSYENYLEAIMCRNDDYEYNFAFKNAGVPQYPIS